ncbi:proliferating cell nuclear antigen, N-terminal domain-containing protein [Cristinia sonorae]|uniref:DNA sliding clamp PCNA n=1 Tax=Cristinia sonorae TaxID=1940300 RepID=A0A8K0UHG8_9AGAR|nr:proliferating cell nuclear antigen, N-terminal domain-containing protein [Cristinia sonorae]
MLEAKLAEAGILKRLLDAIKELVTDANFECNEEGIHLQAMDNSHVALVSVKLDESGFKAFRCDRPIPLGVNLNSLTKVLKCAKDDDICILKAADDADLLSLTYEARNSDRIAEYDMKLMDIDSDKLGIPDTDYDARVTMPSSEFGRIVRDLSQLGESVRIEVSKEGVRFLTEGEAANGNILLKQTEAVGKISKGSSSKAKKEEDADDDEEGEGEEDEEDEDGEKKKKAKKDKKKVKKEADEEDVEMEAEDDDEGEFKADDDEGEEEVEEEESSSKKRKRAPAKAKKSSKKAKKSDDDDELPDGIRIEMNQHVNLTFSLKYLVNFAKSSSLSNIVQLMLSNDVPLLVSYEFGQGHIRYYLAPKIGDE